MWKEFKEFISQGNVMDLAVGVIIGGAFGNIVTSLVNNILMPIIGVIIGGIDFSGLSIKVGSSEIMYGAFIQSVIDFLIIAFCIFMIVKALNSAGKLLKLKKEEEAKAEEAEEISEEVQLLTEIRDVLKNQK